MTIKERIDALRQWMSAKSSEKARVAACIIPTADAHNDEYIPNRFACREWITGFTGSAGLAVVTKDDALLWTDSRYWLQAEEQLRDTPFRLMREGMEGIPSPEEWLNVHGFAEKADENGLKPLIAIEPDMTTFAVRDAWRNHGFSLYTYKDGERSAFNEIWDERPSLPAEPIDVQNEAYTGKSVAEKLQQLREAFSPKGERRVYILNDLSDIAWTLNLRGRDIPYNPVFLAYLAYDESKDRFTLFTHIGTMSKTAREEMKKVGVRVEEYNKLFNNYAGYEWVVDPDTTTVNLEMAATPSMLGGILRGNFSASPHITYRKMPVESWRAVKTEAEQKGFRLAMERDGAALVGFLRRLDEKMAKREEMTEISVDELLTSLRAKQDGYEQLSFATIAAYGPHGAIVHYEADETGNATLGTSSLILIDSGAQYDCGTTDITRTLALGIPTEEEKKVYTLVLKGHLALQRLHFPDGANGLQIDLAARQYMWAEGYDFGHGTGHGVGSHLCVHEGPHQIRKNPRACTAVPLREGMTVTDEPGIYVEGKFGVRIENTLLIVRDRTTPFGSFLRFEPLTLCPYDLRPVDFSLLSEEEVNQINEYHNEVYKRLRPLLTDFEDITWLEKTTSAVSKA